MADARIVENSFVRVSHRLRGGGGVATKAKHDARMPGLFDLLNLHG